VKAIRRFTVRTVLPEALAPLGELALNLRWCWDTATQQLFTAFFTIIRDTLRDLLGDEWSTEIAQAWDTLLVDIDALTGATG